jgi:hypothetical protein
MAEKRPRKIATEAVDALSASVSKALEDDFPWITKSAMLERAYFLGVFACLREIAKEDDLKGFLLKGWADTANSRAFDNTFSSTRMGKAFDTLDRYVNAQTRKQAALESGAEAVSVTEALEELMRGAEWHEDLICQARAKIEELTVRIGESIRRRRSPEPADSANHQAVEQQLGVLRELEHWVRIVALLETDHNRWKGLEP